MWNWLDRLAGRYIDWRLDRATADDPELRQFNLKRVEHGSAGWEIVAFAPAVTILAEQAAALLEAQNAKNYVQFDMMPRLDRGLRPVRVTVQWADGESPAAKVTRLENELALERGVSADRGVTLATLGDMVLGEEAADRSEEALLRAVGVMKRNLGLASDQELRELVIEYLTPWPEKGDAWGERWERWRARVRALTGFDFPEQTVPDDPRRIPGCPTP